MAIRCRKKAKLEEERAARENEIREFQRAHYREMRDAAERNRRQIMSDIGAEKINLAVPDVERKQASPLGGRAIPEAQGDPNLMSHIFAFLISGYYLDDASTRLFFCRCW